MNFNQSEEDLAKSRMIEVSNYTNSFTNIGSYEEYEDFLNAKKLILEERAAYVARGYSDARNIAELTLGYMNELIAKYEQSIPQSFRKKLLS